MQIALAQIDVISGNIEFNLNKMKKFIQKSAREGNDLVVFPEMTDTGYEMDVILDKASSWKENVVPVLQEEAKKNNINVIAGVSERVSSDVFNSVACIDKKGELIGSYRKTHLITAEPMLEHHSLKSGEKFCVIEIEGKKIGIMTCYEIRFPEIARILALRGVELIVITAAWPLVRLPHWENLVVARAIENQVFVAATSRIGKDKPDGLQFAGTSMLISPYGNILSKGTQIHEGLIQANIDFGFIKVVRDQIKVHQDRRIELYTELSK